MASPEVDIAVGYTLSAATANSAWSPQIVDITPMTVEVDDIDTSHQGTSTARTHQAADIKQNGQLVVEHHFEADDQPVLGGAPEVWVLGYPDGEVAKFTGYVQVFTPASHVLNGKMMATTTIQTSGDIANTL